ncbi:MAG: hypothetical protein U0Z53_13990 [Blastocatellia bacterium]
MKSTPESKGTWHHALVQTRRSQPSGRGGVINAGDFIGYQPVLTAARSSFPVSRREGAHTYAELKEAARTAPTEHLTETGREQLQADTSSLKATVIFSTPRLPSDFAGLSVPVRLPADCSIAAGPSHLATITSTAWAVFDKSGQQVLSSDLPTWFAGVASNVIILNPRIIYDQFCGRWLIVACGRSRDGKSSCFLLSFSQTRNPTGAWWNWSLDAGPNGSEPSGLIADSLGVGLDNSALYLTANMSGTDGRFHYAKLRIINKSELMTGSALVWRDCWDLRNPDDSPAFGLQAAHTFGTPGIEYLLNATSEGRSLTQWRLTQPLSDSPQLALRTLPVVSYQLAPDAPQPGARIEIETGDTRLGNVIFRNGSLWAAHTVAANWDEPSNVSAIQWFQINTGAGTVAQQHIYGHPSFSYFCPTMMVDGRGNLIMVFNRVSETEYPSIRFTGRLSTDAVGMLHASVPLRESLIPAHAEWGSYNGAAVDTNDTKIWIVGQYPASESEWGTWIGETSYMAGSSEGGTRATRPALVS